MRRWLPWRSEPAGASPVPERHDAPLEPQAPVPGNVPPIAGIPNALPRGPGGIFVFESEAADRINRARMGHLATLGLPLQGRRVLDVGAGIGKLARFFVDRGCRVVCVEGRAENVAVIRERYADVEAVVADVQTDALTAHGSFDVVFCYGLLYHTENPLATLRNLAARCGDLLLIETIVCDFEKPVAALDDESAGTWNQSLSPLAMRPSPAWVTMALSRLGFHVYMPHTVPDYEDYQFEWKNNGDHSRDGHPLRAVFVGSRQALTNPALRFVLAPNVAGEP